MQEYAGGCPYHQARCGLLDLKFLEFWSGCRYPGASMKSKIFRKLSDLIPYHTHTRTRLEYCLQKFENNTTEYLNSLSVRDIVSYQLHISIQCRSIKTRKR